MKKIVTVIAVSAMALTLAGCKDAYTDISNPDKTLVTIGDTKITQGDIYETAKKSYGASYTLNEALNIVCEKENIKLTDEMKKSANDQLATLKASAGDDFANMIKKAGYKTEEEYKKNEIYPSIRQQGLVRKYVESKQSAMFKTYAPRKAEIIETDSKEKAQEVLNAVKGGKRMSDAYLLTAKTGDSDDSTTQTYKGKEEIYTSKSNLPTAVFDKIKSSKKAAVIDSVIEDTTSKKFYVVKITNADPTSFKTQAIDKIIETGSNDLSTASSVFYLNKYGFKVYDKDVYDGLKAVNEKYVEN